MERLTTQEITAKALEILRVLEQEYENDALPIALGTALILAIKIGVSKAKIMMMVDAVYTTFEASFGALLAKNKAAGGDSEN